jgi:hypothetical protein
MKVGDDGIVPPILQRAEPVHWENRLADFRSKACRLWAVATGLKPARQSAHSGVTGEWVNSASRSGAGESTLTWRSWFEHDDRATGLPSQCTNDPDPGSGECSPS